MSEPEERQSWLVGMTERRRRMLTFINAYMAAEGVFPTIREMGAAIGVSSTSLVVYNLNRLIDAGAIDGALIRTNKPRARADLSVALKYFGGCAYCGSEDVEIQRDHFVPFSRGGDDTADNIVPACRACNKKKGNKDPIKWVTTHFGKDVLAIILYYLKSRSLDAERLRSSGVGFAVKNTSSSAGRRNRTPQGAGEMTAIEAARHFGVTNHTIVRWIKQGYLAGRKRGTAPTSGWLIPESEVRRLEAQLAGNTPPQEAGHAEEAQTE